LIAVSRGLSDVLDALADASEEALDSSRQPFTVSAGFISISPAAWTGATAFLASDCAKTPVLLVWRSCTMAGSSATRILSISRPGALKLPTLLRIVNSAIKPSVGTGLSTRKPPPDTSDAGASTWAGTSGGASNQPAV
jgi:hypothetical protein